MGAKKAEMIEGLELISLDECVVRLQALWKLPEPPYQRRTLLNKICRNEFKRYGPHRTPMVDWIEVKKKELKKFGG